MSHPLFKMGDMDDDQLQLLQIERPWRLDARTRAAGRRGVAQAREALRQAAARQAGTSADDHATRAA